MDNRIIKADPFGTELSDIASLKYQARAEEQKQKLAENLLVELQGQVKERIGNLDLLNDLEVIGPYYVYLVHFDRRYQHAGHYCGLTHDLHDRLDQHSCGGHDASKLMRAVYRARIPWTLVKVWAFDDVGAAAIWEQKVKKKNAWYCPICKPALREQSKLRMREKRKGEHGST